MTTEQYDMLMEMIVDSKTNLMFNCTPKIVKPYRNIDLSAVTNPLVADFSINFRGEIKFFSIANTRLENTVPFLRMDKRTNAKQIWMKKNGLVYSINYDRVLEWAFNKGGLYLHLEKYQKESGYTYKMIKNLKQGISPKWR